MYSRVSVAELIDSDVPLRPDEAVAIIRDVCRQYASGSLRGIPNTTVIRLTHDGTILVEGPVSQDHSPVPAAAALLNELLPGFETPHGFKVPGGLRLVLARASGTLDLPPFTSVAELGHALERFAAADLPSTVRALFQSWAARQDAGTGGEPAALTISDIRRARRATGLTLDDVSRASAIPAERLRELEWGYVRHWTADADGRAALGRYARAAGLDEDLVVSVAWPLVESEAGQAIVEEPRDETAWALVPVVPQPLTPARSSSRPTRPPAFLQHRWATALAAAVLLVAAALWMEGDPRAALPVPAVRSDVSLPSSMAAPAAVQPATYVRVSSDRPVAVRPRGRKPAPQKPRPARRSFFQKEILRIVFR